MDNAEVVQSEQEVDRTDAEYNSKRAKGSEHRERVRRMVQDDGENKAGRSDISNNMYNLFTITKNNEYNQRQGYCSTYTSTISTTSN